MKQPRPSDLEATKRRLALLREEARLLRRASFLRFVQDTYPKYQAGWVHRDVARRLEKFSDDVAAGLEPRLMLFLPPRHGKSFMATERFPIWHLGRHPDHLVAITAHGQELASKFSRKGRAVARIGWMGETFPEFALDPERTAVQEWETTQGGGLKAVGVGGGLTGSGAHVLIIDDPVKDQEDADSSARREAVWDWYTSTAYTRLMPGGGVLVIMTRWHHDDLAGRLLRAAEEDEGADQWEVISYPAIAEEDEEHRKKGESLDPVRWPLAALAKRIKTMGPRKFGALYQQRPTPEDGNIFKRAWFRFWSKHPRPDAVRLPKHFDRQASAWDLTFSGKATNDWNVGQAWGTKGDDLFLLDQVRDRMDYPTMKAAFAKAAKAWPDAFVKLVENKANGPALLADLAGVVPGLKAVEPKGDKTSRANAISDRAETGHIYLPHPSEAPWVEDFLAEVCAFPNGAHDDQVDAMTMGVSYLTARGGLAMLERMTGQGA